MRYVAIAAVLAQLFFPAHGSDQVQLDDPIRFELGGDGGKWYVVNWGLRDCPALARDGTTYVIALGDRDRLCTSTRRPTGLSPTSYVLTTSGDRSPLAFSGDDGQRRIWGMATRKLNDQGAVREVFFFGTKEQ